MLGIERVKRNLMVLRRPFLATGHLEKAMTLIEIIIVIALLGGLMAYLYKNIFTASKNAQIDECKLAMQSLAQDLQMYRVHNHKYPTTEQGLDALLTAPGDAKNWRGPYGEEKRLNDPWDTKFQYESDGLKITIRSAGPDQQFGNEDDITFPEEKGAAPQEGGGG